MARKSLGMNALTSDMSVLVFRVRVRVGNIISGIVFLEIRPCRASLSWAKSDSIEIRFASSTIPTTINHPAKGCRPNWLLSPSMTPFSWRVLANSRTRES
jgi:hypothetical protein